MYNFVTFSSSASARGRPRLVGLKRPSTLTCEALEPTCQNDARAPTSVCGALAETCLHGALSEQSSSSRPAGCSHAEPHW